MVRRLDGMSFVPSRRCCAGGRRPRPQPPCRDLRAMAVRRLGRAPAMSRGRTFRSIEECFAAAGRLDEADAATRVACGWKDVRSRVWSQGTPDLELFLPLGLPRKGDWLAEHKEVHELFLDETKLNQVSRATGGADVYHVSASDEATHDSKPLGLKESCRLLSKASTRIPSCWFLSAASRMAWLNTSCRSSWSTANVSSRGCRWHCLSLSPWPKRGDGETTLATSSS